MLALVLLLLELLARFLSELVRLLNRSKTSVRGVVADDEVVPTDLVASSTLNKGLELELKLLGVGEVELELEIDAGAAGGRLFDAPADFNRRDVADVVESDKSFWDFPSLVEVESDGDGVFFM